MHKTRKMGIKYSVFALVIFVFSGFANPVHAFDIVIGPPPPVNPPPPTNPNPPPPPGPGISYISGRLGPAQAGAAPPIGTVLPDDFCLPGKFDDCGDHLRDAADYSPIPQSDAAFAQGPIFVGRENLSFSQNRQSIWINGQTRQTDMNAISEQRTLSSFSLGGDRRFGENLVLGAMVVSSNSTTNFGLTGVDDTSNGFQAGPYLAYRLSDTLVLDGRFIFGNANHTVTTGGTVTGQYQSQSGFGAVRISATFDQGNWRLHPSLEFARSFQNSDAYTDTVAGAVTANSVSDSFATAAMLAYYSGLGLGNSSISPYIGLELTTPIGNSGSPFGAFRTGVSMTMGNGAILNFDYAHGAIGLSDTEDRLISLRLEIPL